MKSNHIILLAWLVTVILSGSCKKGGGNTNEENLVVETLPLSQGQLEAPTPGPNFPLKITIKSAMPSGGIKIDLRAKIDGGASNFFSTSVNSTSSNNDLSISGATRGIVNLAEITITSNSKPSNTWSGNFKFSMK